MTTIVENQIETISIEVLQIVGWKYQHGLALAPEAEQSERDSFEQVLLLPRLRRAIARLNPNIPAEAQEQALRTIQRIQSPELITNNEHFHRYLTDGVPVQYRVKDTRHPSTSSGTGGQAERSDYVWLIDFENAENNEFLAVNQYTVVEKNQNKRPDIVLFVNGIPLVVIELKNAADENATIRKAYEQIQTYKATIPSLFTYNALCVISDGMEARAGSISSEFSRFMVWKTADGKAEASRFVPQLETLIKGMLNQYTLLDLIRHFILFEKTKKKDKKTGLAQIETVKKVAAYHQYYAVNKAVESTVRAVGPSLVPSQREGSDSAVNYRGGAEFSSLVNEARELRKKQTPAEEIFWQLVLDRKFQNLKFRRQHQIGQYIVDFYCDEKKIVVELDGGVHKIPEQQEKDKARDEYLASLGMHVLRITNNAILEKIDETLARLAQSLSFLQKENRGIHPLSLWERPGEGEKPGEGNIGSRKGGVVWHTQGSGKSISMVFYAGKLVLRLDNPTIVVITDRNDLDNQLFDTFAASKQLLRQEPVQAENREHLKELLKVASGGIVFTTIQKFFPEEGSNQYECLSERSNIVVIADEAHRTQYGFEAKLKDTKDKETKEVIGKEIGYGFAKYLRDALPKATYIGFTGTPIEKEDRNTPAVFGNYVDIYDIAQAVEDKATVKIYYESRLAKVNLDEEGRRLIEELDKELDENDELDNKQLAKTKWAKLEAIVGNTNRLKNLAKDIVTHFEERQTVNDGKGMIVAMSRRIAVDLYNEIIALRPEWHNDELTKGAIKVVMTASSADGPAMQKHHTTKTDRQTLSDRMKDPDDPMKLVIVRDMWLTGFDVPSLHTMYIDKPMRGHTLMQAIARVNRVFKDKPGGLVVDYLGIASDLKKALSFYSNAGGKGEPTETQDQAVAAMIEKLEVVRQMFSEESVSQKSIAVAEPEAYYGLKPKFNYPRFFKASPQEKLSIILQTEEHVCGLKDGKMRFIREVTLLSQAFALSIPHPKAMEIKEEVAFFQAVRARLVKFEGGGSGETDFDIETAIKQVIDQALSSEKVVDIFDAAGIRKPEISILSDEFLLEIQGMKYKNLALELLKKILNDEIKIRSKYSLVMSKKLLEMLETAIKKYQNNLLSTAEIIQELINLAKEVRQSDQRGEQLHLSKEELAFYDALEVNDSAVQVLGDETLRDIAREVAEKVKANATIDWTIKESARAKLMVVVRRTLNKYGYPPDKQQKAIDTVLKQAELMADYFVSATN
jgi:type I site-specific restriction-modification system R (restriction) subunit/very-short-patch-repair endonuclease